MFEATVISGDPRARGRACGRALAPRIRAHVEAWTGSLAEPAGGDAEGYVAALLRDTDFIPAIRAHAPDLLDELEGVAEGAGLPFETLYALQLLDEEWAYRARRAAARGRDKCSSFAVAVPGGPTWVGQNMDLGHYTDGFQALLRVEAAAGRPAALVFTTAGMLGLMGVNASGLGVCVNSLPQLPSAPEGVPVAFVIRRLLQATSLAEAARLVLDLPHATNQHYVLAEPGAVRSFEACAAGVTEHHPPAADRVLHTNHPLSAVPPTPEPPAARANSEARLRSLVARLGQGAPDLADLQAALAAADDPANPVCRIPNADAGLIGFTTGAMIARLGGGPPDAWFSPGPPSLRGWSRHALAAEAPA